MKFGCSECLCIAIESHRPALLKFLLQRTDIVYRDVFWAPTPREWAEDKSTCTRMEIPMLHYFGADSDLSFVGREDCGHMRVDADVQTPFDVLWSPFNAYILVSLPLMARWHCSKRFNAERILLQSGQFDYSSPQFFHVHNKYTYYRHKYYENEEDRLKEYGTTKYGPLHSIQKLVLRCECEIQFKAPIVRTDRAHSSLLFEQRSAMPHGMCTMQAEYVLLDQLWNALS